MESFPMFVESSGGSQAYEIRTSGHGKLPRKALQAPGTGSQAFVG